MKTKLYISFRTASLYKSRITDCCFYSVAEDNSAICYQLKHTGFSTKQVEDFNEVLEDDKINLISIQVDKIDSVLRAIANPCLRKLHSSAVWAAECLGISYPTYFTTDELYDALRAYN